MWLRIEFLGILIFKGRIEESKLIIDIENVWLER